MPIQTLIAQAEPAPTGGGLSSILFLVAMVGVFWLLFIRPQRNRMKQQQELQSAVTAGDRIQTIGGIQGRVVSVDEDSLLLELESGRMRIAKRAVAARLDAAEG